MARTNASSRLGTAAEIEAPHERVSAAALGFLLSTYHMQAYPIPRDMPMVAAPNLTKFAPPGRIPLPACRDPYRQRRSLNNGVS